MGKNKGEKTVTSTKKTELRNKISFSGNKICAIAYGWIAKIYTDGLHVFIPQSGYWSSET